FHFLRGFATVFFHGLQYISDLISNGFESRPGKMGACRSSGDAEKCTSRILVPMGSTQSGKGGNKINPVVVFYACGQRFTFFGMTEKLHSIPLPLIGLPADKYTAFLSVIHFLSDLPGNGG